MRVGHRRDASVWQAGGVRTVRRVVLLVWAVVCGFAAQAVVYALAQLVIDPDATLAWAVAIVAQLATFGLVAAGVYTLKADGPFVQGRRAARVNPGAAPPARPGGR
jgi:hypothetical protein